LSDENIDTKSLDDLFHEKAIDNTAVYVKANEFGPELFGDITPEERKQKLDNEVCLRRIPKKTLYVFYFN
jgi:hypothetical protein